MDGLAKKTNVKETQAQKSEEKYYLEKIVFINYKNVIKIHLIITDLKKQLLMILIEESCDRK